MSNEIWSSVFFCKKIIDNARYLLNKLVQRWINAIFPSGCLYILLIIWIIVNKNKIMNWISRNQRLEQLDLWRKSCAGIEIFWMRGLSATTQAKANSEASLRSLASLCSESQTTHQLLPDPFMLKWHFAYQGISLINKIRVLPRNSRLSPHQVSHDSILPVSMSKDKTVYTITRSSDTLV